MIKYFNIVSLFSKHLTLNQKLILTTGNLKKLRNVNNTLKINCKKSIGGVALFTENFDYIMRGDVCIQCIVRCNTVAQKELNYIDHTIKVTLLKNSYVLHFSRLSLLIYKSKKLRTNSLLFFSSMLIYNLQHHQFGCISIHYFSLGKDDFFLDLATKCVLFVKMRKCILSAIHSFA